MINSNSVIKKFLLSIFLLLFICSLFSQGGDSLDHKVYKLNYRFDIPFTAVATGTALWGFATVNGKPPLDSLSILALDANDINKFDRSATWQDAEFAPTARRLSDFTLALSNMLPFMLMFDESIRQDWGDVLLLFLETQAIVGNLYSWGCVVHVDRIRPLVYNEDVPWEERSGTRTKNAFYSGHTSLSASASFFAAKVYCDYHPELENTAGDYGSFKV